MNREVQMHLFSLLLPIFAPHLPSIFSWDGENWLQPSLIERHCYFGFIPTSEKRTTILWDASGPTRPLHINASYLLTFGSSCFLVSRKMDIHPERMAFVTIPRHALGRKQVGDG